MGLAADIRAMSDDLPALGNADERDVGQQLQLERDPALLARLAELGERRGAARWRHEVRVAAAAVPPRATTSALARVRRGRRCLAASRRRGPSSLRGTADRGRRRRLRACGCPCRGPARRLEVLLEPVVDQRRRRGVGARARRRRRVRRRRRRDRPWARASLGGRTCSRRRRRRPYVDLASSTNNAGHASHVCRSPPRSDGIPCPNVTRAPHCV